MKKRCLACQLNAGEVVAPGGVLYSDDHWSVDHALNPGDATFSPLKGHMIVRARRHVKHVYLITAEESVTLGLLLRDVAEAVARAMNPQRVYVCSIGEAIEHLHWHVIPRYQGMPANPADILNGIFRMSPWPCPTAYAVAAAEQIKEFLDQLIAAREQNLRTMQHPAWR